MPVVFFALLQFVMTIAHLHSDLTKISRARPLLHKVVQSFLIFVLLKNLFQLYLTNKALHEYHQKKYQPIQQNDLYKTNIF